MARLIPLAALAATLLVAWPAAAQEPPSVRTVTVSGTAEVSAAPDMATLTLGVEAREDTAAEAMAAIGEGIRPVLARLEEAGIADADIRTSALDLAPLYRRDPNDPNADPEPDGFRAATTLSVNVRELGQLTGLLDAVVQDGANRLQGLSLGLQDTGELLAAARRAAVEDALAKAELMAGAAGLSLGPVLSIREQNAQPLPRMASQMAVAADVPIAAGSVELSARVEVVVELVE